MSNQRRTQIFEDAPNSITPKNPKFTITPCTRLLQLTIESQSNGNARTKHLPNVMTPMRSLHEKFLQAGIQVDDDDSHRRNLDMVLDSDKISIMKDTRDIFDSSSDEEDESDGDLFSSGLYLSSPERPTYNDQSVPKKTGRAAIFDEDDDEDVQMDEDVFDTTSRWLDFIYHDSNEETEPTTTIQQQQEDDSIEEDDENRPPRSWIQRNDNEKKYKDKKYKEQTLEKRSPLQEIQIETDLNELSDTEDAPAAKKKLIISGGKSHKVRIMRALSPTRFPTKRKGSITSHSFNSHSLTNNSTI